MAGVSDAKVLVMGVTGMLGHKLYQVLSRDMRVYGTMRGPHSRLNGFSGGGDIIEGVNAVMPETVTKVLDTVKPTVVVNCIGVVKQSPVCKDRFTTLWVNALFPPELYEACHERDIRLIHISTDCVFSGVKGNYTEEDTADAQDDYGISKHRGEVTGDGALTIRTSMIGRELFNHYGLLDWLISQKGGTINGYGRAIFTGLPTVTLAGVVKDIIINYPDLSGLYHIGSNPISKHHLLELINERMRLEITINEYDDFVCDRSLDSSKFRAVCGGYHAKPWPELIDDMLIDEAAEIIG